MKIKVDIGGIVPTRAYSTDAGIDLYTPEEIEIPPHEYRAVDLRVQCEIPYGYFGDIRPKSGLFFKKGIITTGTVDSGYTGSIKVNLVNLGKREAFFRKGDKIAQMVIIPCKCWNLELVNELDDTERGNNGFGSTGE